MMKNSIFKQAVFIITYAVLLVLLVIKFNPIMEFVEKCLSVLSPLFVGIAIAFVLDGPYKALRKLLNTKLKMKDSIAKGISITVVYIVTLGAIVFLLRFIIPEIVKNATTFAKNSDSYVEKFQVFANTVVDRLGMEPINTADITKLITSKMDKFEGVLTSMLPKVFAWTSSILTFIINFVIALVLSIYIMAGQKRLVSQVSRTSKAYLPEKAYTRACYIMEIVTKVFKNYISGQMLDACILGTMIAIVMAVMGIDYAALTGIIIAVTALIPIIGAWIGGGITVLLQLFVSPKAALIVLIIILVVQQIDNNLVYPRVVGNKIGLPGIWVMLGVTVGGGLFGLLGMFIGVPVTTVAYVLLKTAVNDKLSLGAIDNQEPEKEKEEEDSKKGSYTDGVTGEMAPARGLQSAEKDIIADNGAGNSTGNGADKEIDIEAKRKSDEYVESVKAELEAEDKPKEGRFHMPNFKRSDRSTFIQDLLEIETPASKLNSRRRRAKAAANKDDTAAKDE